MNDSELVKFVAERCMGWHGKEYTIECSRCMAEASWNPLESISDAWMLVDRMRELGWWVCFAGPFDAGMPCKAKFFRHGGDKSRFEGYTNTDTAPRAITLACVAALEGGK